MLEKLVIIDGNSIFYRSFYALPLLNNSRGEFSNAIYGFAMQILSVINNIKPKYLVVAFDVSKHTFRHDIFPEYKATRKPMPDELRSQIAPLKEMLSLMNIKIIEKEGLEGDDIIGIVAKKFPSIETIIVTGDRDSFQLVDASTKVYFTKKGTSDVKIMGVKELKEEFGVSPKEFIDLKALQGDSADNIPGVAGIGTKTASDLIQKFGCIEKIYENIEQISGKLKEKLLAGKNSAFLSKTLATIVTQDESFDFSLGDFVYSFPFSAPVYDFFKYYEFKSLLKNMEIFDLSKGKKDDEIFEINEICDLTELEKIKNLAYEKKKFAFFFDEDVYHLCFDKTEIKVKLSFNLFNEGINDVEFFEKFKSIFENEEILKISFDSKKDMYYLKRFGCELKNYFDISISKYLVDGVPVDGIHDVFFDDDTKFIASKMMKFFGEYLVKIEEEKLQFLFNDVEIPLSKVLFSMENYGFKVDREVLNSLKKKYYDEQEKVEKEIFEMAGETFNLNSPKQLASVIFDKLKLPHNRKQSTNAESLELIQNYHPIIEKILRYRKINKFLTTYIDGLLPHIDGNGFIHTKFKQTLTTTGRLSSVEPNLQNIPIRSEESREIRSMFVASSEDNVLIDADYSQIELRLLAHISNDPGLINAFNNNIDIHRKTASEVFGVSENLVTSEMRRMAKVVNFGIIYGISDFGLAEDLKISQKQAREFINNFYLSHPQIKQSMENLILTARETGMVETMFGRRRKMFDINSSNYNIRTRAERAIQNMPLQGSAADIIKIAMVNTFNALEKGGFKARLIMQIHDELIIDCPKDEREQVERLLREQMVGAAKLNVALEVDVRSSYRWSDGH